MAEYFDNFPYLRWKDTPSSIYTVQDITIRIILDELSIKDKTLFFDYKLQENETLELVAEKAYGDYTLSWVIMIINKLFHRDFDLPMTSQEFSQYILDKYKSLAVANQKVYYIKINDNEWTPVSEEQYNNTSPLRRKFKTYYEIEHEKNEEKRNIKLLVKEYMPTFLERFKELVLK